MFKNIILYSPNYANHTQNTRSRGCTLLAMTFEVTLYYKKRRLFSQPKPHTYTIYTCLRFNSPSLSPYTSHTQKSLNPSPYTHVPSSHQLPGTHIVFLSHRSALLKAFAPPHVYMYVCNAHALTHLISPLARTRALVAAPIFMGTISFNATARALSGPRIHTQTHLAAITSAPARKDFLSAVISQTVRGRCVYVFSLSCSEKYTRVLWGVGGFG